MQTVIDAHDSTNLADNQDYQAVMVKLPAGHIGYGYIDLGAYLDAALEAAESELSGISSELINLEQVEAFRGAGYSVGFEPNGLRVDFVMVYDEDALPEELPGAEASPNKAVERVPSSTLLYFSGTGLDSFLQGALDAMQAMPDQPEDLDEQLQMMTAMLGVTMDELMVMLSGEYAVAIAHDPSGLGGDSSTPVGVSLLIEAKDEEQFTDLINSVSALLGFSGEMALQKETIGGVEVTTIPGQTSDDFGAGVGVGNGFFVIATSRELLETAFGGGGDTLDNNATYLEAVAPLPEKRAGLMFINMEALLDIVAETMGPAERESFDQARPVLAPIRAISAAAEPFGANNDSVSGTLFILIESE
jgi:hypothetical protein